MIKTRVFRHDDRELWGLIGPFVADVTVRQELGNHQSVLTSRPGYLWVVLTDGEAVVGFGSIERRRDDYRNSNNYVIPSRRQQGLYHRLISEMALIADGVRITARCTERATAINSRAAWTTIRKYGKYTEMRLDTADPDRV